MSTETTEIAFHRTLYRNVCGRTLLGKHNTNYEVITALQTRRRTLPFRHFQDFAERMPGQPLSPARLHLPAKMGQRILTFCEATYVEGQADFNCFAFAFYTMGWEEEIQIKPRSFFSVPASLSNLEPLQPYMLHTPGSPNGDFPHAFLPIPRPAHALNVTGNNQPLTFNSVSDMARVWGANQAVHIVGPGDIIPTDE
jgi:hypothetical protein